MNAEIIAIGDELTSGQRVDTNSAWLSQRLGEIGIHVLFHTTAADELDACRDVFAQAMDRADIIISTGGLGPTADDLTRQALADATGCELQLDEASLAHIHNIFESRGREMPERNQVQAMFPTGSRVIPNPHGTAPGIDFQTDRHGHASRVFCLPGVPAEMREMWHGTVQPALIDRGAARQVIVHRRIKCFGIGESDLERRLPDLIQRGREPSVGITVHKATITLRVTARGETEEACLAAMQPTIETIHECLGSLVFGSEDEELEHAVVDLLQEAGATLATAEWGTPGILTRWLREATHDLSPCPYAGGITATCRETVAAAFGAERLPEHDPAATADWMASQVRELLLTTYGLSVGPIDLQSAKDPNAELHVALAGPDGIVGQVTRFVGHPDIVFERSAKQALNLLRRQLAKRKGPA